MKKNNISTKKRIVSILCAFTLFLTGMHDFLRVNATVVTGYLATVSADVLNIRPHAGLDNYDAGSNNSTIGQVKQNDQVYVIDDTDKHTPAWYKIQTADGSLTGYCCSEFLVKVTPEQTKQITLPDPPPQESTPNNLSSSIYSIDSAAGYISTISAGTTVTALLSGLTGPSTIKVYNGNNEVTGSALIGTGMTVKSFNNGQVYQTLTALVTGDVNGDGCVDIVDLMQIKNHILHVNTLSGIKSLAADINKDFSVDIVDLMQIKNKILNINSIKPLAYSDFSKDYTLHKDKTLYTRVDGAASWTTSNPSIATVDGGYILGVSPGIVAINALDSNGNIISTKHCEIIAAESMRTAYAAPNIAGVNQAVTLTAVTDATRNAVKFDTNGQSVVSNTYTTEGTTRVFTAPVAYPAAGNFEVKAYSSTDGGSSWSSDFKSSTAYIIGSSDLNTTTTEIRRASDNIISMIATWEGYSSAVYPDTLAGGIPTIGYGYTFGAGTEFYNGITQREAYALLVNTVNNGSYTSGINSFLRENNMKANQHQFDALVSMAYNLGTGFLYGSNDPGRILRKQQNGDLNNVNPVEFANEMLLWTRAGDYHYGGLLRRRMVEVQIFNYGIYQDMSFSSVFTEAPKYGYTVKLYDPNPPAYGYK